MGNPYRTAQEPEVEIDVEESPEAILFDTLKRLNNLDLDDAQRVVRGLAAFMGFDVGRRPYPDGATIVDSDEEDDDGGP